MMFDYEARWTRAMTLMDQHGIDALVLMKPANLAYLTGDGRPCSLALLSADGRMVVTAPTCDLPSVRRLSYATDIRGFANEEEMFHGFRDILAELGLSTATLALEKNFFDAALHEVVVAHVMADATVVSAAPIMSRLRMLKDPAEVACLQVAGQAAAVGMAAAVEAVRPGVRESIVAGEAEHAMRAAGAEGWASPTYVASGWRTAMAHGPSSSKAIEDGDVVQVHVAPIVDGYTVDLCRTIFCGQPPTGAREALEVYIDAQEAGIAAAVPGQPLLGIDEAMARVLSEGGYADAFLRPVFHGVGMEHEEAPIPGGHAVVHGEERIDTVDAGMVLAIGNCGIYRADFGVRAEDTVHVGPQGPEPLTVHPKRS